MKVELKNVHRDPFINSLGIEKIDFVDDFNESIWKAEADVQCSWPLSS